MQRIPWRRVLWLSLLGTALATALVVIEHEQTEDIAGGVINPGEGPATAVVIEDFPNMHHPDTGRHDGPMNYAIARELPDLDQASASLDRPAYRLQRPLYPALARALYPPGRGPGLLGAIVVVGVLALFVAGIGAGGLSTTLGGPSWPAVLLPLAPGCLISLRISVSDSLAIGLALLAVMLSLGDRRVAAAVLATLAVLAKEPTYLVIAGFALWRRDRDGLVLAAVPAAVAGAWALYLRLAVPPGDDSQVVEFTQPLEGLRESFSTWSGAGELSPTFLVVTAGLALGIVVLVRDRLSHPLSWPILLNLILLAVLKGHVINLPRNGTRAALPLLAVALIAFVTPKARKLRPHGDLGSPAPLVETGADP